MTQGREMKNNMKNSILAVFFLILANSAYGDVNYIKYINEQYNFKIIIPGSWEKYDLKLEKKCIMYASKDKNTVIKVRAFKSSDKDIEELIHEKKWDLRSIDPRLNKIIETKKIKITKNMAGKILVFEYRSNRNRYLQRVMITKCGNIIYIIECKSPTRCFYKYNKIFNTALSSFSFIQECETDETDEEKKSEEETSDDDKI